jgi:hypothetical protein
MDDADNYLSKPNVYVGPAPSNDEDVNEVDPMSQPDAAPALPAATVNRATVGKSMQAPRQLPTAHDIAGKFTTPDKDTGVGHKGKNTFDHLGKRVAVAKPFAFSAANNAPPDTGTF